ncbi:MAG: hypothetical protein KR126chlam3_00510, partial [Chlamydiae bacterium]|nr:hypothetical protein [Chlamydiota bacterium]
MTTEILLAFSRLSKPGLSSLFTDEKLTQIARSRKISEKKVANIIARHLLHNFSVGPSFLNQSKILRTTYDTLNVRYREIVDALLKNKEVEFLPSMQELLRRKSYYGTRSKEEILRREMQRAILATDELVSFSRFFPISQSVEDEIRLATNVNAERLFGLIDTKEKSKPGASPLLGRSYRGIPAEEGQQLARFFYKHVALYKEGKILTWKALVEQWVKQGADRELVSRVENLLPLNWLRGNTSFSYPKKGTPTFQAFVYNQTIEVLEDLIKVNLDDELRRRLFDQMSDEKFRMNLVFYLGHPDYLLHKVPTREDPAYHWLRAIRRFLFLRDQRNFDSINGIPLFRWAFYAESVPLAMAAWEKTSGDFPHVPIKWDVNSVIEAISDLEKGLPGVAFQKSALELVYILEKEGNEFKGKTDFILKLSQSKYAEVSVEETEGFFRSGGFDRAQYERNLQTLERLLDEMKAQGKSKRFLPLLGARDLSDKIDLAKQAIRQVEGIGIEADQLLAIFQNVLEEKIDLNLLTAAKTWSGIPIDVKRNVFTGPLPNQVHSDLPRMLAASAKARESQSKYGFTPVETFQCYLWML